jgi:hypothetical protein
MSRSKVSLATMHPQGGGENLLAGGWTISAPDTNTDKQEKRHKPALLGIRGAMIFGVLMIILLLFFVLDNGRGDDATDGVMIEQNDGTTSTVAPVDPVEPGTNESN